MAPPTKPGDLRRRLHDVPGLVVQLHVHGCSRGRTSARTSSLRPSRARRPSRPAPSTSPKYSSLPERLDALLERRLRLVLVARVGVHDVPLLLPCRSRSSGLTRAAARAALDDVRQREVDEPEDSATTSTTHDHDDRRRARLLPLGQCTLRSSAHTSCEELTDCGTTSDSLRRSPCSSDLVGSFGHRENGPGRARTCNPRIWSPVLYQFELLTRSWTARCALPARPCSPCASYACGTPDRTS